MKNYIIQDYANTVTLTLDDNSNIVKLSDNSLINCRVDCSWMCTESGTYVYTHKGETRQIDIEAGDLILKMYSPNNNWGDKRFVVLKGNDSLKDYAAEYAETLNRRKERYTGVLADEKCADCDVCCDA